jgi:hypothetical protein
MNPDNKSAGQEMVFDKYVAIALVVGIVAGFIIGNSVGASKSKVDEEVNATSSSESMIFGGDATTTSNISTENITASVSHSLSENNGSELEGGEWLNVDDQKAGNTVVLSRLTIDKPYWVAVRDSRATTKNPYILGAKKLAPGTYTDLSIYVSRATAKGKSYDIVFYKDRGATFNYDASMMIMNGNNPVGVTFKAE